MLCPCASCAINVTANIVERATAWCLCYVLFSETATQCRALVDPAVRVSAIAVTVTQACSKLLSAYIAAHAAASYMDLYASNVLKVCAAA
jgi:hypothetical protein